MDGPGALAGLPEVGLSGRRRQTHTQIQPRASARGSALRLLLCVLAGAMLASALLVAWSCHTTRSGMVPLPRPEAGLEITSAESAGTRPEPMMRVRIARSATKATLDGRGPWLVAVEGARTGEILTGPLEITASESGIRIADSRERVRGFGPGTTVYAGPVLGRNDQPGEEIVSFNSIRYPGTLRLVPLEGEPGRFDAINVVELERYIPGVIAKELFPHWEERAFMAQAVAARTFALTRRETARRSGRAYDVDDSQMDQVYGGLTGLRVAVRAAEETRGVVLTEQGKLGAVFYSATCGGHPATPEEIWPREIKPAVRTVSLASPASKAQGVQRREVLCQSAPLYEWQVARRTDELVRRLKAWGAERKHEIAAIEGLAKVEVVERAETGRSMVVRVTDTRGKAVVMSAEHFRTACNTPVEGLPDVDKATRVHSNDIGVQVGRSVTVIKGHGHGHGVGMCQYCAQAMAKRGDDWRTILRTFYPEEALLRIY